MSVASSTAMSLLAACYSKACAPPPAGKGGSLVGGKQGRFVANAGAARAVLTGGGVATVERKNIGSFIDSLAPGPDGKDKEFLDLGRVAVSGTGLFAVGYKSRIQRVDMPQIPVTKRNQFLDGLRSGELTGGKKVSVRDAVVDPKQTRPSQADMDGTKVAKMVRAIREKGYDVLNKDGPIIMSADGKILDGHHRWAAASIHAMENPGFKIPVTIVGMKMGTVSFGSESTRNQGPREGLNMRQITGGTRGLMHVASQFTLDNGIANQSSRSKVATSDIVANKK